MEIVVEREQMLLGVRLEGGFPEKLQGRASTYNPWRKCMALKETIAQIKGLLAMLTKDIEKATNGNKAASQRVRTGSIKLEKAAKLYRKESVQEEKKGGGKKKGGAKKAAKKAPKKGVKKVAKKVVKKSAAPKRRATAKVVRKKR